MAVYERKTWIDRQSEHRGRRKLTPTGLDNVYDVERSEGLVVEEGDAFDAATMNDLERRIAEGFDGVFGLYTATFTMGKWTFVDDSNESLGVMQSAPLVSLRTGDAAKAGLALCSGPMCQKTSDPSVNATLLQALNLVNKGWETLENGVITLHLTRKPTCDISVVWQAAGAEEIGEATTSDIETLSSSEIDNILSQ